MLYEICDKRSFRNGSRYTFCDRKNDKRRRYCFTTQSAHYLYLKSDKGFWTLKTSFE